MKYNTQLYSIQLRGILLIQLTSFFETLCTWKLLHFSGIASTLQLDISACLNVISISSSGSPGTRHYFSLPPLLHSFNFHTLSLHHDILILLSHYSIPCFILFHVLRNEIKDNRSHFRQYCKRVKSPKIIKYISQIYTPEHCIFYSSQIWAQSILSTLFSLLC